MAQSMAIVRPVVHKLPNEFLLLIGEAISAWAVLEYELKATAYLLLGIGSKRGRVAVRSPRASEIVQMIGDLLLIDGLNSRTIDLKKLAEFLDELETRRNTLAHNIWLQGEDGRLFVQSLAGSWPITNGGVKVTRRIEPAGIPIATENIADLVQAIRSATHRILELRADLVPQLEALPKIHRAQLDPLDPNYQQK